MKKITLIKSTVMMLALTIAGLFTFSSTSAQKPIKKTVKSYNAKRFSKTLTLPTPPLLLKSSTMMIQTIRNLKAWKR